MTAGQEEIILPDDPRAAEFKTITGWVSRNGQFWGIDERMARYAGSTHSRCQTCSEMCSKNSLYCDKHLRERELEKYAARPVKPWDGTCMLYSETLDRYFSELAEVIDWLRDEDSGASPVDLRLVLCDPEYPDAPDPVDYYCDKLPESGDVPDEVAEAFDVLAKTLKKCGPMSWFPGEFALDISSLELAAAENEGDA